MKLILLLSLTLFSLGGYVLAEEAQKLPVKAEKALLAAKTNILKTYKEEVAKTLKELEKVKLEATKAGKLEAALAVDKLIKEVSGSDFILNEIVNDNSKDLLGIKKQDNLEILLGQWRLNDKNIFTFTTKGQCTSATANDVTMGVYEYDTDKNIFIIHWTSGGVDQVTIIDKNVATGITKNGKKFMLTRIE